MNVYDGTDEVRRAIVTVRQRGRTVGLVPTMGALHEGHLSLVRAARARCDVVALTLFVNPLQFDPSEDFEAYPRSLDADLAACQQAGVDIVFAPDRDTMFPADAHTTVHVSKLTDVLCGPLRPGHFDGVTTVVAKLFHLLPADAAFFGEKDYQQLIVIRRMVRDLNMPIDIVACPTVRESDGLALSSRNVYLSPDERVQATALSRALFAAADRVASGERHVPALVGLMRTMILDAGDVRIEYIDVVDAETLEPLSEVDRPARICLVVGVGSCRLIDNIGVDGVEGRR